LYRHQAGARVGNTEANVLITVLFPISTYNVTVGIVGRYVIIQVDPLCTKCIVRNESCTGEEITRGENKRSFVDSAMSYHTGRITSRVADERKLHHLLPAQRMVVPICYQSQLLLQDTPSFLVASSKNTKFVELFAQHELVRLVGLQSLMQKTPSRYW
jgi:hypothetical protein